MKASSQNRIPADPSPRPQRHAWVPLVAILMVGCALSVSSHLYLVKQNERDVAAYVRAEARDRAELLKISGQRSLETLHSISSLFEVAQPPSRKEFETFVKKSLERLPQLQALEWIPRVPRAERAVWERRAQLDGRVGYRFTEMGPDGGVRVAGERDEYFPVYYAEPEVPNLPALGLDLASNPERRAALLDAGESGRAVSTHTIRLAQEVREGRLGFLVFQPIYKSDGAQTVLAGFALAVFRVDDFLASAFQSMDAKKLRAVVVEAQDGGDEPLFRAGAGASVAVASTLAHAEPVDFAGHRWELRFTPTARLVRRFADVDALAYPAFVLLLTVLVCAYVAREQRARRAMERANERLQAEVLVRKRAEREAARATEAQANFLASMSHEIRTPLNAIVGYCQILHRQLAETRQEEAVSVMLQSSNHLLALVDDILDLSKIESGHVQLSPVDFNLGALLSSVLYMFRPKCQRRGLGLRFDGVGLAPHWVRGDEQKLRQVLINLLGNAVKFTEQGEVCLSVALTADQKYEFEIRDTGRGMGSDEQSRIFKRFYRGQSVSEPGTGLGLAISRQLVEVMGGEFSVRSAPGQGTVFSFRLSLGSPVAVMGEESKVHVPRVKLREGSSCTALVVDDLKVNRDILCEMLEAIGCVAIPRASGKEALENVERMAPDVVFMDVCMPEMDGFETTRNLLDRLGQGGVKVVAFSASVLPEQRARYLDAGFDDFLPKPFRAERINEILSAHLGLEFVPWNSETHATWKGPVRVPRELEQQLLEAARLYQATHLRGLLDQLEKEGQDQALLAERLRVCATTYDMDALIATLRSATLSGSERSAS